MKNKIIIILGIIIIVIIAIVIFIINKNNNDKEEIDYKLNHEIEFYYINESNDGLKYPVFNINSIEIDRFNKEISRHIDESIGYKDRNEKSDYYEYDVNEINNFINVLESHVIGKDDSHNKYVYHTISKETGKILTNEEIINIYHYDSNDLWNKVTKLINKEKFIKVEDFSKLNIAPYYEDYIMVVLNKENKDNLYVYNGGELIFKR